MRRDMAVLAKEDSTAGVVAIVLVLLAVMAGGVRYGLRHRRDLPSGDSLWRFRYEVAFEAEVSEAQIVGPIPAETGICRVFRQRLSHPGVRVQVVRLRHQSGPVLVGSALNTGSFRIVADQDIHIVGDEAPMPTQPAKGMDAEQRSYYLRSEPQIQASHENVRSVLRDLQRGKLSVHHLVERVFEYCTEDIARDLTGASDALAAIQEKAASPKGRARAMVALCRTAKIPARLVCGFELEESNAARPHTWVEVLLGKKWVPFDVDNGFKGSMSRKFFAVRQDSATPVSARTGIAGLEIEYAIRKLSPLEGFPESLRRSAVSILDLTQLPVETRRTLALILLLPLGALITAVLRNMVGLQTFGTFTPSLIAMSFVYADVRIALIVFGLVIAIGLGGRFVVERMKLLVVPRLSAVLTLVVIALVFSLSALDYFNLSLGSGTMLMPLVIHTMLIERMHVTLIEEGMLRTIWLLAHTLIVTLVCYMLLKWRSMGHFLISYPEFHGFTLAAIILVGRYNGYRLGELWRFKDFAAMRNGGQE